MLCQKCKKNQATHHTREVIGGEEYDYYYCDACYADLCGSMYSDSGDLLFAVLGGKRAKVCPECGMSYREYEKTGLVGCAKCYHAFQAELLPIINRIHGKSRHIGKLNQTSTEQEISRQIANLQDLLEQALIGHRYQEASELNAQIKELNAKLFGGNT